MSRSVSPRRIALLFLIIVTLLVGGTTALGLTDVALLASTIALVVTLLALGYAIHMVVSSIATWREPATLNSVLFRAIFVTLLALSSVVWFGQWWSARQDEDSSSMSEVDRATAELRIAYREQPIGRGDSGVPADDPLTDDDRGLWFDAAAYRQIEQVIRASGEENAHSNGGSMLLDGRDSRSYQSLLPPSVYRAFRAGNRSGIGVPGYSNPPFNLPPVGATYRQSVAHYRRLGEWIKEHGWQVGLGTDRDGERVRYALWRTGPDTASWIYYDDEPQQEDPWWVLAVQWGIQAVLISGIVGIFAGAAAGYLAKRIAGPVKRVAAASTRLASGTHPAPIPREGPAELITMVDSLNLMAERLNRADAAQQEFLSSVSHELKTPLTAIEGYAELLGDGAVSGEEASPVLVAETGRLRRLVGDLLDSARLQEGTFSVRLAPVDLSAAAGEVVRRHGPDAQRFGVELTKRDALASAGSDGDAPPPPVLVLADEDRLLQVLSNLTENALRCTPAGGRVEVEVTPDGAVTVADTGPGLSEEEREHAFERFYLYERYGKDRPVGTGLGLAIVKQLTEAMGGAVEVSARPEGGTVFRVGLRLAPLPIDAE